MSFEADKVNILLYSLLLYYGCYLFLGHITPGLDNLLKASMDMFFSSFLAFLSLNIVLVDTGIPYHLFKQTILS